MWLALGAAAIVVAVLASELTLARLRVPLSEAGRALLQRRALWRGAQPGWASPQQVYDPGRELRAEQRAQELLRSCVNEEEWAMYRDLGFLRVAAPHSPLPASESHPTHCPSADGATGRDPVTGAPYAYLLYPHRPIVAYVPRTGALLNEYCVAFPDETRPYGSARLPDADDVLAKWMALKADERRLIAEANMHLPGRQLDPRQVREDLARMARWEHERAAGRSSIGRERGVGGGSPPEPAVRGGASRAGSPRRSSPDERRVTAPDSVRAA
jgi:hypothetical protein